VKHLVRESEEAAPLAVLIERADRVSIDTETFGKDAWHEKSGLMPWNGAAISGLSVGVNDEGYYLPIGHRLGQQASPGAIARVVHALNGTKARHVMHHAQYDWAVLEHLLPRALPGIVPFQHRWNTYDTQTRAWLDDENRPKALKVLGDLYLDYDAAAEQRELKALMKRPKVMEMKARIQAEYPEMAVAKWVMPKARSAAKDLGWGDLYPEEMAPYAAQDGVLTLELMDWQGGEWTEGMAREMRVQEVCYRMRERGVLVDQDRLREAGWEYQAAADGIQEGFDFDLTKVAEVREYVYTTLGLPVLETTDKGTPSTARGALEQQMGHPKLELILEHRRLMKAITAYVEPLFAYAEHSVDGLVHAEFSPVGTVTGRFSSSLPNLQQIPKGSKLPGVRESFRAQPGTELWSYDLASAELWIGASITKDPTLTAMLLEGRDMHAETAMQFFGSTEEPWRTLAKNINYGIPYGAGPQQISRFAAKAGLSPEQAARVGREAFDGHKAMFPQYHRVSKNLARMGQQMGRLPLYAPERYRHQRTRFAHVPGYVMLNSLVQGGVAEVMKDVMVEFERAMPGLLRLQVHDELVTQGEPGHHVVVLELLNRILADVNPFSLPLRFEAKQW
jgi:DNA polymerase I-like protein with 3'-5' exonuclease and polymerase domains